MMWPYKHLERAIGAERLTFWFDSTTIVRWKAEGIGDYEADEVSVRLGRLPHDIFPGWMTAGLDCDVYP